MTKYGIGKDVLVPVRSFIFQKDGGACEGRMRERRYRGHGEEAAEAAGYAERNREERVSVIDRQCWHLGGAITVDRNRPIHWEGTCMLRFAVDRGWTREMQEARVCGVNVMGL